MKFTDKLFPLIKSTFLGKPIHESANLEDFRYARWCLYLYILLAATYWYFEIGIPHWDGPKEDFRQLMEHEALVKLTVVFGAAMGLIALLHRSIVSDYQIKQQSKIEVISNFYKVSEHINSHAEKIIPKPKNSFISYKSNFPYGITKSLFQDARNGNYNITTEVINRLNEFSENFNTARKTISGTYINIFYELDEEEGFANLFFALFYPILNGTFILRPAPIKTFSIGRLKQLVTPIAEAIETDLVHYTHTITDEHIDHINGFHEVLEQYIKILESIENLLLTIPLSNNSTDDFFTASESSKTTARVFSDHIKNITNHIDEIMSVDEYEFKKDGKSIPNTPFRKDKQECIYNNRKIELSFIYCCMKLDIKPKLSNSFSKDDFNKFINNLHLYKNGYGKLISEYLDTLEYEKSNNY
ncbi:hypothetical protein [Thalassolituus sp.]|uniref:hypothetical protein n=1 Tax=Thalassolituus sp. TaxID=2030822 RepID=UPI00351346E3